MTEWNIETLRLHVLALMDEREKRYDENSMARQIAIDKAEAAVEKRFAGVNELRGALDDAAKMQMPRIEANAKFDALAERLSAVETKMNVREGETAGSRENKGDSRATWAIVIAVGATLVQLVIFYVRH